MDLQGLTLRLACLRKKENILRGDYDGVDDVMSLIVGWDSQHPTRSDYCCITYNYRGKGSSYHQSPSPYNIHILDPIELIVLKDDHTAEEEQDADAKGQEASGQATHKVGDNAKLQIIGKIVREGGGEYVV